MIVSDKLKSFQKKNFLKQTLCNLYHPCNQGLLKVCFNLWLVKLTKQLNSNVAMFENITTMYKIHFKFPFMTDKPYKWIKSNDFPILYHCIILFSTINNEVLLSC